MRVCPACSATSPVESAWCGLCFTPLRVATAPPPAAVAAGAEDPGAPMLSSKALALVALAIGIGIVATTVSWALGRNDRLEPETYIRYAIVLTLGVYVVVGALIVTRLAPGVALRWHRGQPARSILVGAFVGLALGGALVWLSTAATGHLTSDPRFVTLMSEGDLAHILVSFLISVACAPLVEEALFRGLLLESMASRSVAAGLFTSAVCFALWHLNIAVFPLIYYSVMGCVLGTVYLKRGLAGSMAAHAAFNGVLSVAALAIVLAPTTTVSAGGVSLQAPGGWRVHDSVGDPGLVLDGPSEAELLVHRQPVVVSPTTATMLDRIRAGLLTVGDMRLDVDAASAREARLPAGAAVEVDITADGHAGTLVYLPQPGAIVEVVFFSAGSVKARSDFPHMLDSLRVG